MHVAVCRRFASPFWVARGDMPAILSICLSVRSRYKTSVGDVPMSAVTSLTLTMPLPSMSHTVSL